MVHQTVVVAEKPIAWLGSEQGEDILIREIRLRGVKTGNYYATAFSVLRHLLLPENLRQSLLAGTMGIGVLIRDCGLETYRQVLDVGVNKQKQGVAHVNDGEGGRHDFVFRTYRIILEHHPVILITESFPSELYV
jgi:chorismate-pyruvate lyase